MQAAAELCDTVLPDKVEKGQFQRTIGDKAQIYHHRVLLRIAVGRRDLNHQVWMSHGPLVGHQAEIKAPRGRGNSIHN